MLIILFCLTGRGGRTGSRGECWSIYLIVTNKVYRSTNMCCIFLDFGGNQGSSGYGQPQQGYNDYNQGSGGYGGGNQGGSGYNQGHGGGYNQGEHISEFEKCTILSLLVIPIIECLLAMVSLSGGYTQGGGSNFGSGYNQGYSGGPAKQGNQGYNSGRSQPYGGSGGGGWGGSNQGNYGGNSGGYRR